MVVEEDILGHFDKVEEACRYLIFQMLGVVVEDMVVDYFVVEVVDYFVEEDMVVEDMDMDMVTDMVKAEKNAKNKNVNHPAV